MKKILIIQNINEAGPKLLIDHPDYEFEIIEDINDPSLKDKILDCDGVSLRTAKLTGDIISLGKKIQIISRHGVGYDNIDLNTCKQNNVKMKKNQKGKKAKVNKSCMFM